MTGTDTRDRPPPPPQERQLADAMTNRWLPSDALPPTPRTERLIGSA